MANEEQLWFVPLGGTGEIGMNLNLFGHNGQWLMVDCGITFDEPLTPNSRERFRVVAPDPEFITKQKETLAGIIITHAHEDHIGAVAHLWPRFRAPIYTTRFTAEVLRRKLAQKGLSGKVPIIEVNEGTTAKIGVFDVTWLGITHSIPEPCALLINTAAGALFHSADWKIDHAPGIGKPFASKAFELLGSQNILGMTCDSTNALKAGSSVSERDTFHGLLETIKPLTGRVVVTCFASNIARLIALAKIAKQTGRYMAVLGRSLNNMVSIARVTGYWPDDVELIESSHVGYLPANEVLVVATGSQGEPKAALHRLALDSHFDLNLDSTDTVIFSAMIIPGNELDVERMLRQFAARNIRVILSEQSSLPIHASGHPCKDELYKMYQWVKPEIAIPLHGEPEHLEANANMAKKAGIRKTFVGANGDLYQLAPMPMLKRNVIKAGRIIIEA